LLILFQKIRKEGGSNGRGEREYIIIISKLSDELYGQEKQDCDLAMF
jgi:hypothetical protein